MGRILVLGASGFLGRHVCAHLRSIGIEPIAVARTRRAGFASAIDLITAKPREILDLLAAARPTAVINCSGAVRGTTTDLMRGNVVTTASLLWALRHTKQTSRLVHLGSSAEYGAPSGTIPMDESTDTSPTSPYGYSKLAAAELILHARSEGTDAAILRIFNVSGPNSPTSTMLGALVKQLKTATADSTVTLDSLEGWRDYVDVRDVASAACMAALLPGEVPPVTNIGRGEAVRTGHWVQELIEISKTGALLRERPESHSGHKSSAGAVAWQCADIAVARRCLNWTPAVSLSDSLRDTWLAANA